MRLAPTAATAARSSSLAARSPSVPGRSAPALGRSARPRAAAALAAALLAAGSGAAHAAGDAALATWDLPVLDRWFYPFNSTPGTRINATTFGVTGDDDPDAWFDDRDGQMLLGWNTAPQVPAGLGAAAYEVVAARVIVEVTNNLEFTYDDTPDPWQAFLPAGDREAIVDPDPGQPVELFGVGWRNGFGPASFPENGPYSFVGAFGEGIRSAHALGFDAGGAAIDVSNHVRDRFQPAPWAVGVAAGLAPGDLVPQGTAFTFELDVADAGVQQYLAEALDAGTLRLMLSSLTKVVQQGGEFPSFYCKEHPDVQLGFQEAARLENEWREAPACPADLDGDGTVGFPDLLQVLTDYGPCPGCPADLDGDGTVGFPDLLELLTAYGPC